ncbi:hypothetical protein IFM89_026085 [Coptis chinensis]|uniref:DUF4283 domain-containing protein n=1 Tax=Coptis chinensis TaxID=261450 RepID=A0A835LNW0_9MAGN|nr:hypothetical protein IFM89_026085 [Coptis chinensis]
MSSHVGASSSSPSTPPTWSSLFGNQGSSCSDGQLDFFEVDNEVDVMDVPSDILEEGVELWKDHLGVHDSTMDRRVRGSKEKHDSLPIWVKIWDIPNKQMWTKKGISFIASRIGKPHCWDEATRKKQRLDYAKVCIEVPVNAKFHDCLSFNLGKVNQEQGTASTAKEKEPQENPLAIVVAWERITTSNQFQALTDEVEMDSDQAEVVNPIMLEQVVAEEGEICNLMPELQDPVTVHEQYVANLEEFSSIKEELTFHEVSNEFDDDREVFLDHQVNADFVVVVNKETITTITNKRETRQSKSQQQKPSKSSSPEKGRKQHPQQVQGRGEPKVGKLSCLPVYMPRIQGGKECTSGVRIPSPFASFYPSPMDILWGL